MIRVCETGRNPTMRHLGRTHYVQVSWLKERFKTPELKLQYTPSAKQAADIYTKPFDNGTRWDDATRNIAIVDKFDSNQNKAALQLQELNHHINGDDDDLVLDSTTNKFHSLGTTCLSETEEEEIIDDFRLPKNEGIMRRQARLDAKSASSRPPSPGNNKNNNSPRGRALPARSASPSSAGG